MEGSPSLKGSRFLPSCLGRFLLVLLALLAFSFGPVEADIKIVSAGWGRTGSWSLRAGLMKLGYNSYHMFEILGEPFHKMPQWIELYKLPRGTERSALLKKILSNYNATTDFPCAAHWEEILEIYPDAKVLLPVRPAQKWYESAIMTILKCDYRNPDMPYGLRLFMTYFPLGIWFRQYDEYFNVIYHPLHEKELVMKSYDDWNEYVKRTAIKPGQLFVYELGKLDYESLCEFLGISRDNCPKEGFPHVNDTEAFENAMAFFIAAGYVWAFILFSSPIFAIYLIFRCFLSKPKTKQKGE